MKKNDIEEYLGKNNLLLKDAVNKELMIFKEEDPDYHIPVSILKENDDSYFIINERNNFYLTSELKDYKIKYKEEIPVKKTRGRKKKES